MDSKQPGTKRLAALASIMNASQKRMKLMARIMAETLVAPAMRVACSKTRQTTAWRIFRFACAITMCGYDPQEWRDGCDMTINVGLGTGDKEQQHAMLMQIVQTQAQAAQAGALDKLVSMQHLQTPRRESLRTPGLRMWTNSGLTHKQPPQQTAAASA